MSNNELVCPVCGKHTFKDQDAYEICPVCDWEDDPVQRDDPDYKGGANRRSLNEHKTAWDEQKRKVG
jgi:uncharacterized Zn finger protein (UPF0148 family)